MLDAIGSIAGTALSSAANIYMNNKNNKENRQNAKDQMDFQERMSNSAHQRQIADLKKAGLNPALSANSGASAPVGASSTSQAGQVGDFGASLNSGKNAKNQRLLQEQQLTAIENQNKGIESGINKTNSDISVNEESKKLIGAQTTAAAANALNTAAATKRLAIENKGLEAELPARTNEAKFRAENPELYYIDQVANSAGKAIDAVGSAVDVFNPFKKLGGKIIDGVNPSHIKRNSKGDFFNSHTGEIIKKVK